MGIQYSWTLVRNSILLLGGREIRVGAEVTLLRKFDGLLEFL